MADGWLQTTRLSTQEDGLMQRFMAYSRLHRGEAESIALANARGLPLIVGRQGGSRRGRHGQRRARRYGRRVAGSVFAAAP